MTFLRELGLVVINLLVKKSCQRCIEVHGDGDDSFGLLLTSIVLAFTFPYILRTGPPLGALSLSENQHWYHLVSLTDEGDIFLCQAQALTESHAVDIHQYKQDQSLIVTSGSSNVPQSAVFVRKYMFRRIVMLVRIFLCSYFG